MVSKVISILDNKCKLQSRLFDYDLKTWIGLEELTSMPHSIDVFMFKSLGHIYLIVPNDQVLMFNVSTFHWDTTASFSNVISEETTYLQIVNLKI